jgi:hypothetical protein
MKVQIAARSSWFDRSFDGNECEADRGGEHRPAALFSEPTCEIKLMVFYKIHADCADTEEKAQAA